MQNYEALNAVGDLVGLIRTLKEPSAIVIGHDLGSRIASYCAELRPDLFRALVVLNVPIGPRHAHSPSELFKQVRSATGKRYYHDFVQDVCATDRELNADIRKSLRSILYSVSGGAIGTTGGRFTLVLLFLFTALVAAACLWQIVTDQTQNPSLLPSWLRLNVISLMNWFLTKTILKVMNISVGRDLATTGNGARWKNSPS